MNYDCSPTDDQRLRKHQACTRQDFDPLAQESAFEIRDPQLSFFQYKIATWRGQPFVLQMTHIFWRISGPFS